MVVGEMFGTENRHERRGPSHEAHFIEPRFYPATGPRIRLTRAPGPGSLRTLRMVFNSKPVPRSLPASPVSTADVSSTLGRLRLLLLGLVALGAVGLTLELLLLEHWEEWRQWTPLILLVCTALGAGAVAWRPRPGLLRGFRILMLLAVVSGVVGAVFHYESNAELEREIHPELSGPSLVRAALGGGTPTLAPGAMIQLGLLGLLAVFRHPAGRSIRSSNPFPGPSHDA